MLVPSVSADRLFVLTARSWILPIREDSIRFEDIGVDAVLYMGFLRWTKDPTRIGLKIQRTANLLKF